MTNYVSNINDIPIGGKFADGQWEYNYVAVAQSLSVAASGTVVWNLTTQVLDSNNQPYIPDDGNDYAIIVRVRAFTASSGTSRVGAHITPSYNSTGSDIIRFGRVTGISSSAARTGGTHIIRILASDRTMRLLNSDAANAGTFNIEILARRRLGTNA